MAVHQYYVAEIQQYANGEFGHIIHYGFDENLDKARLKTESKYHEVLAAAAVSELPSHAAIMFSTDGVPLMYQCYKHEQPEPTLEPEPEETEEPTE